ncbi:sulfite exporter TauE/SafE family protein [Sphingomonas sp.]|uniref:sulfite exporter TauE/SafE family protein n=1 Tax=Sphingomonas sp. TaxID=28214 RepID=UPI00286D65B2|nr:sulfite exporter TauE/SafE family protein [Sphingomonas sp.]
MFLLAGLFFLTALLYAVAGFGGASTYTALLVLVGSDYRAIPVISLLCNILVVSVGTWRFARAGHLDVKRSWPLFVTSVPAAWLGGRLVIGETLFVGLLAAALLIAGLLMLWQPYWEHASQSPRTGASWVEPVAGGVLGFVAGVVGIGGGIFLAPLLYLLRWASPKAIAATCAAFILVNSISGLVGQASKGLAVAGAVIGDHLWLFPAVIVGGLIGSAVGSGRLDPKLLRIVTALLILYVGVRLALRWWGAIHGGAG